MMCYSFSQSPHVHCATRNLIQGANSIYLLLFNPPDPQYFSPELVRFWPDGGYLQKTGALWRILRDLAARMRLLSTTSMPTSCSLTGLESVPGRPWSMVQKFDTEMAGWYYVEQCRISTYSAPGRPLFTWSAERQVSLALSSTKACDPVTWTAHSCEPEIARDYIIYHIYRYLNYRCTHLLLSL